MPELDVVSKGASDELEQILEAIRLTRNRQSSVWLNVQPCVAEASELFSRTIGTQGSRIDQLENRLGAVAETVKLLLDDREIKEQRYVIDRDATQCDIKSLREIIAGNYRMSVQNNDKLASHTLLKLDEMNAAVQNLSELCGQLSAALCAHQNEAAAKRSFWAETKHSEAKLRSEVARLTWQWKSFQSELDRTQKRAKSQRSAACVTRATSTARYRWVYNGLASRVANRLAYAAASHTGSGDGSAAGHVCPVEWSAQLSDDGEGDAGAHLVWADPWTILVRIGGLYEAVVCVSSRAQALGCASKTRRTSAHSRPHAVNDEAEVFLYVNKTLVIALPQAGTTYTTLQPPAMTQRATSNARARSSSKALTALPQARQEMCTKTMHHYIYLPTNAPVQVSLGSESMPAIEKVYFELRHIA